MHKHQCGLTTSGFDSSRGCGHVWEHDEPDGTETSKIYAERHICPKCGNPDQRVKMDARDEMLTHPAGGLFSLTGERLLLTLLAAVARRIIEEEDRKAHERLFGK